MTPTEAILSILVAVASSAGFWAFIQSLPRKRSAVKEALGALLRHEMWEIYRTYKDAQTIPADMLEEMDSLHTAYHSLGYNHMGDKIWEEIMKKPTA